MLRINRHTDRQTNRQTDRAKHPTLRRRELKCKFADVDAFYANQSLKKTVQTF